MSPLLTALALAAAPSPQPCTFETATPTDVREMARNPERWFDRCVRLDGFVAANVFYEDVAGAYRRLASDGSDRPNDGWLGLYFSNNRDWQKPLRRASVVGIVHSCERIYDRAEANLGPNQIVFVTGYCHYTGGLILRRVEAGFGGQARFTRQIGEQKRAAFGDLLPASSANLVPAKVRSLVEAWSVAFQARDRTALRSLVNPYDWTVEKNPKAARRLDSLLSGASGPFQALRGTRPEPTFFSQRIDKGALAEGETGDWFACFCKSGDCRRLWPIAAVDAKALENRPYVCLRVYEAMDGSGSLELGLESQGDRLIEPKD